MANFLPFVDQTSCDTRNHAEAIVRGCAAGGKTQYWWPQVSPYVSNQIALIIPSADITKLTAGEQTTVVTSLAASILTPPG